MSSFSREQIRGLSVAERIRLIEELWDSICESPEDLPLTEAQREELDRRLQAHAAEPDAAKPWPEVRDRLKRGR